MEWLKNLLLRGQTVIATYKKWRVEALEVIESEVGKGSWALKPVIKEIHTLPYIGMKWIGGHEA
jgi:hypothetical protein